MKKFILKSVVILIMSIAILSCSSDSNSDPVVTKTKVRITSYQINAMSFTAPDGLGWDITNGPDVYVGFYNGSNLVHVSDVLPDVPSNGLPIGESFLSPYYLVPNFSDSINFYILDEDIGTDNDDLIGNVSFVMADYTTGPNKYPSTVNKLNGSTVITLNLIWED